jgi:hypothetical protein
MSEITILDLNKYLHEHGIKVNPEIVLSVLGNINTIMLTRSHKKAKKDIPPPEECESCKEVNKAKNKLNLPNMRKYKCKKHYGIELFDKLDNAQFCRISISKTFLIYDRYVIHDIPTDADGIFMTYVGKLTNVLYPQKMFTFSLPRKYFPDYETKGTDISEDLYKYSAVMAVIASGSWVIDMTEDPFKLERCL